MIDSHMASAGLSLLKRSAEGGPNGHYDLPTWALVVVTLTSLVFLPAFIFVGYTLKLIYPSLAMVEDPDPPAYEPVPLSEDADGNPIEPAEPAAAPRRSKPLTSSIRATNRLLYSVGGWRASLRGIRCSLAITGATVIVGAIFAAIPLIPQFVGTLLASLALVQLHTAWVHIVISNPSPLPFWKRLPPFRRTFEATSIPVTIYWLAVNLVMWVPSLLVGALGLPVWDPQNKNKIPEYEPSMLWKFLIVVVVFVALSVFAVVPSQVVLVRVQASLLPPEEDPILPLDRSFKGTVEPAIVGGRGYVSGWNALKSFPRSSWKRLYVLYIKIFAINWVVLLLWAAVVLPEIILLSAKGDQAN